jgi:cysteine synthase
VDRSRDDGGRGVERIHGALRLACEMCAGQVAGSIVTLTCDSGARYTTTYDDDAWLAEQGIDISPYLPVVERAWNDKAWAGP